MMGVKPICSRCAGKGYRNMGGTLETCLCSIGPRKTEHYSTEQVKRHIIQAMVDHGNGEGLAVSARRAADQIIDLLVPNANHKHMGEE